MPNRSAIDIKACILKACLKRIPKTHIMYTCNLSYSQVHNYSTKLYAEGFLHFKRIGRRQIYTTTGKGKRWLKAYKALHAIK